ncbi:hypothetical protein CUMW_147810 [Citrus unshiu]|nr:hypothetical protein CUMW_147810 [Citrus unshiu]
MGDSDKEGEYEVDDLREGFKSSRGSRFNLIANQFGFGFGFRRNFSSQSLITGIRHFSKGSVIHPDNRRGDFGMVATSVFVYHPPGIKFFICPK